MLLRILSLACISTLLALLAATAAAQGSTEQKLSSKAQPQTGKPHWTDLTPMQREALQPLHGQWDKMDLERKRKWLEVASRYPNLSPEGKQRFHERLPMLAGMTPTQRETARDNFRKAYELPFDQRQAVVEQYKQLPEEKKRALATQPKTQSEPPRRVTRSPSSDRKGASSDESGSPARSSD